MAAAGLPAARDPVSRACLAQWGKRWDQITVFTSPAEASRGGHPALLTGCHLAGLPQCRKDSQITAGQAGKCVASDQDKMCRVPWASLNAGHLSVLPSSPPTFPCSLSPACPVSPERMPLNGPGRSAVLPWHSWAAIHLVCRSLSAQTSAHLPACSPLGPASSSPAPTPDLLFHNPVPYN